jgi:hypothetical protein
MNPSTVLLRFVIAIKFLASLNIENLSRGLKIEGMQKRINARSSEMLFNKSAC